MDTGVRQEFPHAVEVIEHTEIPLADGTRLAARIWLPQGAAAAPVPAILEYLPYRKRDGTAERDALTHPYFAGHGYACVRVDMRGTGEAEGVLEDEYTQQELDEGVEVIDWIAAQPWCSGAVGMIGISWGGFNGLQIAALRPEALKAIVTICSTDDRYADDVHYMGGCLIGENLEWGAVMFSILTHAPDPDLVGARWREMWLQRLENVRPWAAGWMRHQRRDAFWKHGSVCEDYARIQCPVYAVGGWEDGYSNAVFRLLAGLQAPAKGLIGPWAHKYPHFAEPGPRIGFLDECLRWWDHWLKGRETGIMAEPQLRVWMQEADRPQLHRKMRAGRWVAEAAWPSGRAEDHVLHLNADGLGRNAGPEAALRHASPQTLGHASGEWCSYGLLPDLAGDQRHDDAVALTFDGAPLDDRLEILGAPLLELELTVDRPVAKIAVRLNEVWPDGASTRVSYGVRNLTHDDSHETATPLVPGERYRVRLRLNDTAHAFAPGNRIRVAVSTAYWPLLWPAPEPVALTLFAGRSRLALPRRPAGPLDDSLADFGPALGAAPERRVALRPADYRRSETYDQISGERRLAIVGDSGNERIEPHGLEVGGHYERAYRILPDDPLSAEAKVRHVLTMGRGTWHTRTATATYLTATPDEFLLSATLDAYEGDHRVFTRTWSERIPRDGN